MTYSKQLNFIMTIGREFLITPVTHHPTVYVRYKLYYDGKVEVMLHTYLPDVPENISDWKGLKEKIKEACEKHSKRFLLVSRGSSGSKLDDEKELLEWENQNVYK